MYLENIFLGINQLLLHLFAFVIIETFIFYLFIVKNMEKSIRNMFKRVSCKTYKQIDNKKSNQTKIFKSGQYQEQLNEDMEKYLHS